MKELRIVVQGTANSGKSTLLFLLDEFLKENGFDVEIKSDLLNMDYGTESNFRYSISKNLDKRKEALKNAKITLTEQQMNRNGRVQ